jgi:hypothetical protein
VSTSFAEASKCPVDGTTGREVSRTPAPKGSTRGSVNVVLECTQTRCRYHDVGWIITIRPDGTIPDPVSRDERETFFPKLRGWQKERGRDIVQNIEEENRRTAEAGAELQRGRVQ